LAYFDEILRVPLSIVNFVSSDIPTASDPNKYRGTLLSCPCLLEDFLRGVNVQEQTVLGDFGIYGSCRVSVKGIRRSLGSRKIERLAGDVGVEEIVGDCNSRRRGLRADSSPIDPLSTPV